MTKQQHKTSSEIVSSPPDFVLATQPSGGAVVYPQETLKLMPQCLLEGCIRKFVEPVDITLGEFAKKQGIAILVSVPSLVQHIGNITTGQSDWFHQAECFLESVEDISR